MAKHTSTIGRYAQKIHWLDDIHLRRDALRTRCGKYLPRQFTTTVPPEVTCKTCRKFLRYWHERRQP
jgi:hypothetical protein